MSTENRYAGIPVVREGLTTASIPQGRQFVGLFYREILRNVPQSPRAGHHVHPAVHVARLLR